MGALNAKVDQSTSKTKAFIWTLTTSDTGTAVDISDLECITVHNIGSGTAQIEVSNDGTNFVGLQANLALPPTTGPMAANTIFSFPAGFNPRFMRVGTVAGASVVVIATGQKFINCG